MENSHAVPSGLWARFQNFIIENGVASKHAKFHLMWVKKYVRFNNNEVPLEISDSSIRGFREFLSAEKEILPWQIEQALSGSHVTRSATHSQPTSSKAATTSARSRSFSDTLMSQPP